MRYVAIRGNTHETDILLRQLKKHLIGINLNFLITDSLEELAEQTIAHHKEPNIPQTEMYYNSKLNDRAEEDNIVLKGVTNRITEWTIKN